MDSKEAGWFDFTRKPTEADQVKCPSCGTWSPFSAWQVGYDECETCGCVEVMTCPECNDPISMHAGYNKPLEVASLDPYARADKDAQQNAG